MVDTQGGQKWSPYDDLPTTHTTTLTRTHNNRYDGDSNDDGLAVGQVLGHTKKEATRRRQRQIEGAGEQGARGVILAIIVIVVLVGNGRGPPGGKQYMFQWKCAGKVGDGNDGGGGNNNLREGYGMLQGKFIF